MTYYAMFQYENEDLKRLKIKAKTQGYQDAH